MQSFTADHRNIPGDYRTATLDIRYPTMVELLGEPMAFVDDGYPNDPFKTDVHWGIRLKDGTEIAIWNYKNGPNYEGCDNITLPDVDQFSVWASDAEAAHDFLAELQAMADMLASIKVVATSDGDDEPGWTVVATDGEIHLTVGSGDTVVLDHQQATRLGRALLDARNVPA